MRLPNILVLTHLTLGLMEGATVGLTVGNAVVGFTVGLNVGLPVGVAVVGFACTSTSISTRAPPEH